MYKTIGIVAHVDAGKTTLSEQILYNTGTIRTLGRVDDKNTSLDTDNIEKSRGITVFSSQTSFAYNENQYYLIDTPGHMDFGAETERSLKVLDYAVLVISAVEGVQSHTVTLWKMLERLDIPVFIFINKTDRIGADADKVISCLNEHFNANVLDFTDGFDEEEIASLDEELMEYYFEKGYSKEMWDKKITDLIKKRQLFVCHRGCALKNEGVSEFLDALDCYSKTDYDVGAKLCASAYKVKRDKNNNRLVFLKILSGKLTAKQQIQVGDSVLKVNEIRMYNSDKFTNTPEVVAGQVCAVTGLDLIGSSDTIGDAGVEVAKEFCAVLACKVMINGGDSIDKVLKAFRILEDEEPELNVIYNEELGEIQIHIMGKIQLEVLKAVILERFGIEVEFSKCNVVYKETVAESVHGCGHFEPLRHYAEVHFDISPAVRNSGISFESACSTDVLDKNWQRLIKTHVFEKEHRGVLGGFGLTDVKITLLAGRAHEKHTEGGDFRQATYRAIRQGLMKAKSILLEPYYCFEINVPIEYMGKVMTDIKRMSGSFDSPVHNGEFADISGELSVYEAMEYWDELYSYTKGQARISHRFGGYAECHNAEQVLSEISYEAERDVENTPDSVFCSHGSGFPVKWDEADRYMHCEIK